MKTARSLIRQTGRTMLGIVALLPLALVIHANLIALTDLRFPAVNWAQIPQWLLWTLLGILPTLVCAAPWLAEQLRGRPLQRGWKAASSAMYVLLLPLTFLSLLTSVWGCPFISQTDDPAHYRQFDKTSFVQGHAWELFPERVEGGDAAYLYWYEYASQNHDVYAAWVLAPDALEAEVARVDALMAKAGVQPEARGAFTCYLEVQRERDGQPREARVFAYNAQTGEVRYALYRQSTEATPFWLQQDWVEQADNEKSP